MSFLPGLCMCLPSVCVSVWERHRHAKKRDTSKNYKLFFILWRSDSHSFPTSFLISPFRSTYIDVLITLSVPLPSICVCLSLGETQTCQRRENKKKNYKLYHLMARGGTASLGFLLFTALFDVFLPIFLLTLHPGAFLPSLVVK